MAGSEGEQHELSLGETLGGRYKLVGVIGQGGVGSVYEAEGPAGQRVAIKVLSPEAVAQLGPELLTRFVREAHISSALPSPYIVPVLDGAIDPERNIPYLVMPMMRGQDLESLLARTGPLPPEVAVRVAIQAARGLRAAHDFGVVHRDVKPSNIFLDRAGDGAVTARVCDFGIAKIKPVDGAQITRTGTLLGSPVYMSPEQLASARSVDSRADVWSLGMTLYHMLAGAPPLAATKGLAELVLTLMSRDVPPLQEAAPWVSPGLARAVHGALLRDLDARCPSMDELIAALRPHAGDSEQLSAEMLAPLPEDRRRAQSPKASLPTHWESPESVAQASTERQPDALLGRRVAGKYVLVRKIDDGPLGAVYEADVADEKVALKLLRPHVLGDDEQARTTFVNDALSARKIQSEYVVKVLDAGVDLELGSPFVASELVNGPNLDQIFRSTGPLEPTATARMFVQACRGLAAAHALGLVHGDVKPTNLLLAEAPGGRVAAKVDGFGLARLIRHDHDGGPRLPRVGHQPLSPMYLAPEACAGDKPVTFRSDIWSLCVTLYEALSGKKPWHGFTSVGEMFLTMTAEDIRPLREAAPWVEAGLAEAVHRGLERDPSRRYASISELAVALGPIASEAPSLTRASIKGVPAARRSVVIRSGEPSLGAGDTAVADTVAAPDKASLASIRKHPSSSHPPSPSAPSPSPSPAPSPPSAAQPPARGSDHPPAAGRSWLPLAGAAVLLAGAAGALVASQRPSSAPPSPEPGASGQAASPKKLRASVEISPASAAVTVNGARRTVEGGRLLLEGEPGEPFEVQIEHAGATRKATVFITRDGKAQPPSLAVTSP